MFGNNYTHHKVTVLNLRIMGDKYKAKQLLEENKTGDHEGRGTDLWGTP